MCNIDWSKVITNEMKEAELKDSIMRQNIIIEKNWRSVELKKISRQLEAIEEDSIGETPPDILPGGSREWLKYRGKVSNWKEGAEGYPDITNRPSLPF